MEGNRNGFDGKDRGRGTVQKEGTGLREAEMEEKKSW